MILKNHASFGAMALLCLLTVSGCDIQSESSSVLENYTRVPYDESVYIDNDAYYVAPGAYVPSADTDLVLDPD